MNIPDREVDRHNWRTTSPLVAYVLAAWVVDRAVEVREVLERRLSWRSDHQMPLRTLLIGKEMLGILGKRLHHRQVVVALEALPYPLQQKLGVISRDGKPLSYRRVEKAIGEIAKILADPDVVVPHDHPLADADTGEVLPCPTSCHFTLADETWYMTAMAHAAIPEDIPLSSDVAMDWTDVPGWAKSLYRFVPDVIVPAGEGRGDYHADALNAPDQAPTRGSEPEGDSTGDDAVTKTSQAPRDADGRAIPSKDEDSRWGHRSRRPGVSEFFVGWDGHTAVGVPERDGTPRAPFTYGALLAPAGSYPGDAGIRLLRAIRHQGVKARDLIVDRGYTGNDPARFARPAHQLVEDVVQDLLEHQRQRKVNHTVVRHPGKPDERTIHILRIAGGYFSDALPEEWDDLKRPGPNATQAEREENRRSFDQRAKYALVRHGHTDAGTPRWAGPATQHAGFKVRCPNNGESMRMPNDRPLTRCTEGTTCSCGEVIAIKDPETEREQQKLVWGTTKWTNSYNRRTTVERGYADDKFQVTGFRRGSICCFGTVKQALYYSPVIVARNLQVALRWYHDQGGSDPWNIDEISRPDYTLPQELGGLHVVEPVANSSSEDAAGEDGSAPEPSDETLDDDAGPRNDPAGDDGVAGPTEETQAPGLNRAQRRRAERTAKKAQRSTSKPPKPPPGTSPPAS